MADAPSLTVPSLTVLILTRNEALHIERAIASVHGLATRILVVDSGSTDGTQDLARAAGAEVLFHAFTTHADQCNWALDHGAIASDWVLRLDADEVILEPETIAGFLRAPGDAAAATLDRRIHFLGRWIRHGGLYPTRIVRLWRTGRGRVEARWMDEHVVVDGPVVALKADFADINLNSLGWWTAKHNDYATREAIQQLLPAVAESGGDMGAQARRKRWLKSRVYNRLPLGLRPLLYFLYRYILRGGFRDGWQGLVFHGLQAGWYRFLVDAKIAELRAAVAAGETLPEAVARRYGIALPGA